MAELVINKREEKIAHDLQKSGEKIPSTWFKDNILFTLFLNSSSLCIPDAERFVVESVTEITSKNNISVPKKEVDNLLHEEIAHSKVHDAYNEYLQRTGLLIDKHIHRQQRMKDFLCRNFSLKTRLAFSAMIEHYTASMAKQILDTGILEGQDIDERMERIWVWHALEELDHRSATFDVYVAAGGEYPRRVLAGLLATLLFLYIQHACFFSLLRQRKVLWNGRVWRKGLPYLLGKKGLYRHLFMGWLKFFKPGFHPNSIPIRNTFKKQLHHYHIESELISYFQTPIK